MTVNPIGDQSCRQAFIQEHRADRSRRPVTEGGHRVVEMGRHGCAGISTGEEILIGRVGVAKTDDNPSCPEFSNAFEAAGPFRRDGNQAD